MKSFLILNKGFLDRWRSQHLPTEVSSDDAAYFSEVLTECGLVFEDGFEGVVFDESKSFEDNYILKDWADSAFEVYFPSTYNSTTKIREYTPKEEVVVSPGMTTYVHRWGDRLLVKPSVQAIRYLCDDKDPDKNQRILVVYE